MVYPRNREYILFFKINKNFTKTDIAQTKIILNSQKTEIIQGTFLYYDAITVLNSQREKKPMKIDIQKIPFSMTQVKEKKLKTEMKRIIPSK